MGIKLVAIDVDDTLVGPGPERHLSQENIAAVQAVRRRGIQVVLASGRPTLGMDIVADRLQTDVYRISYAGAVLQNPVRVDLCERLYIDIEVARAIARFADAQHISLSMRFDEIEYHTQDQIRDALLPYQAVATAEELLANGLPPIQLGVGGEEPTRTVYEYCVARHFEQIHIPRHFNHEGKYESLMILNSKADKGKALAKLSQLLGVSPQNVMVIGDSENDLSMFAVAGLRVAVANALPSVRAAAMFIAPADMDNGVAWALENLL